MNTLLLQGVKMLAEAKIIGFLTRGIELRYLPSGTACAKTGIASNKSYTNSNGEKVEETCFIDITFWGRMAEVANQYLRKGSKIYVSGNLKYETWTDNNGTNRSKHCVDVADMIMLDSKPKAEPNASGTPLDSGNQ